jgi:hypothetical protein
MAGSTKPSPAVCMNASRASAMLISGSTRFRAVLTANLASFPMTLRRGSPWWWVISQSERISIRALGAASVFRAQAMTARSAASSSAG